MTLTFGRVVPRAELRAQPLPRGEGTTTEPQAGVVVPREVVEAADRARRIVAEAEARASDLLTRTRAELGALHERTLAEARAEGAAALAAARLTQAKSEAGADERALERLLGVARVLAERLLGETLRLEPERVVALARQALAEARGARRVTIVAHPDDVLPLQNALARGAFQHVVAVVAGERARGSLRLETELGVLDAELAPQLARLAAKLAETPSP